MKYISGIAVVQLGHPPVVESCEATSVKSHPSHQDQCWDDDEEFEDFVDNVFPMIENVNRISMNRVRKIIFINEVHTLNF